MFIFVMCSSVPLSAQATSAQKEQVFTPLVFDEINGSYAIYRDTRFGDPAYIGLCALGGNQLAFRLYIPASKTELLVSHTFYTVRNSANEIDIEPGTINVILGDFNTNDATRHFLPLIYDWMDAWLDSRSQFAELSDYMYERDGQYSFQYWIPILQMKNNDTITLVTAGIAKTAQDSAFFGYKGEVQTASGPRVQIKAGTPRTVTVDGLSVPLDTNWILSADGSYRIASTTKEDAVFTVKSLDMEGFGNKDIFDLIKQFVLNSGSTLVPDGLRIFVFNEFPCLYYKTMDSATGRVMVQYRVFVPRSQSTLSVITLRAFESVYDDNREFFDAILF